MRIVRNLSPSIVPTSAFPTRTWFSTKGRMWYYHGPRKDVPIPSSGKFQDTLDPLLEELVVFLHLRRVRTSPSCSGHFHDQEHFSRIWFRLKSEEDRIRSSGLKVTDIESGQEFVFHNPDYTLPWGGFSHFYSQVDLNQSKGYLGIWVSDPTLQERLSRLVSPELRALGSTFRRTQSALDSDLFELEIQTINENTQKAEWSEWTRKIKDSFLGIYSEGRPLGTQHESIQEEKT